jgi:hypothetical protein
MITFIFLYTKILAKHCALVEDALRAPVMCRRLPDQFFSFSAIGSISYPMARYPLILFSYIRASIGT